MAVGQAAGQRASGHGLGMGPALSCALCGDVGAPAGHGELPTPCAAPNSGQPSPAKTTTTPQAPTPAVVATALRSTGRMAPSTQVAVDTLTSWAQDGAIEPLASPPTLHGAGADTAAPGAGAVLLTASPTATRPSTLPAAKCSREDGGHPPGQHQRCPMPAQRAEARPPATSLQKGEHQPQPGQRAAEQGTAGTRRHGHGGDVSTYLRCWRKGTEPSALSSAGRGPPRAQPALPLREAPRAAAGHRLIRGGERERPAGARAFCGAFLPSRWRRRSALASSVTTALLQGSVGAVLCP